MSRSYKHFPRIKYTYRGMKRIIRRKVRMITKNIDIDIGNFSYTKKLGNSWDICDYIYTMFFYDWQVEYGQNKYYTPYIKYCNNFIWK